ncbi:hypothetical protein [Demequina sp. SO4-18]|uniref:hypothetical protein n=1 Tax=Demequina sp. SO4-18 TaxID=3401026 RepID=UPI003B5ACB16
MQHTTVKPYCPDPKKYTCAWCGIQVSRGSGKGRTFDCCQDCKVTEYAFGGAK